MTLTDRIPEDVFFEFEDRIKVRLLSSNITTADCSLCVYFGLLESLKFLFENGFHFSQNFGLILIDNALQFQQLQIAKDLLKNLFPNFTFEQIEPIIDTATKNAPLEILELLFSCAGESNSESLAKQCLPLTISGKKFLNFDFLRKYCAEVDLLNLYITDRHGLVYNAFEYCLPEAKIREYLQFFGQGLIEAVPLKNILTPATAGGYINLFEEFSLYTSSSRKAIAEAVSNAASKHKTLIPATKYVIDQYNPNFEERDCTTLVISLVES